MALAEATLRVGGMTCNHCRQRVTEALQAVPGVQAVEVDLPAGTARVVYRPDQVDPDALTRAVEKAGYQTEDRPAPTKVSRGCGCQHG